MKSLLSILVKMTKKMSWENQLIFLYKMPIDKCLTMCYNWSARARAPGPKFTIIPQTAKKVNRQSAQTFAPTFSQHDEKIFSKNNGFRPFLSRYEESFPEKTLKHTVYNSRIFLYNKENVIVCTKLQFIVLFSAEGAYLLPGRRWPSEARSDVERRNVGHRNRPVTVQ